MPSNHLAASRASAGDGAGAPLEAWFAVSSDMSLLLRSGGLVCEDSAGNLGFDQEQAEHGARFQITSDGLWLTVVLGQVVVNGEDVDESAQLGAGDHVEIGSLDFLITHDVRKTQASVDIGSRLTGVGMPTADIATLVKERSLQSQNPERSLPDVLSKLLGEEFEEPKETEGSQSPASLNELLNFTNNRLTTDPDANLESTFDTPSSSPEPPLDQWDESGNPGHGMSEIVAPFGRLGDRDRASPNHDHPVRSGRRRKRRSGVGRVSVWCAAGIAAAGLGWWLLDGNYVSLQALPFFAANEAATNEAAMDEAAMDGQAVIVPESTRPELVSGTNPASVDVRTSSAPTSQASAPPVVSPPVSSRASAPESVAPESPGLDTQTAGLARMSSNADFGARDRLATLTTEGNPDMVNTRRVIELASILQQFADSGVEAYLALWRERLVATNDAAMVMQVVAFLEDAKNDVPAVESMIARLRPPPEVTTSPGFQATRNIVAPMQDPRLIAMDRRARSLFEESGSNSLAGILSVTRSMIRVNRDAELTRQWINRSVSGLLGAATSARMTGDLYEARNHVEEALAIAPEHPEANQLWRELVHGAPTREGRLLDAAIAARQAGNLFEARNLVEEILAISSDHPGAIRLWEELVGGVQPFEQHRPAQARSE